MKVTGADRSITDKWRKVSSTNSMETHVQCVPLQRKADSGLHSFDLRRDLFAVGSIERPEKGAGKGLSTPFSI